tara:strand:+ start:760 stop:1002 length:243 start_codon:yes stop_codon:yes gene_type:complete
MSLTKAYRRAILEVFTPESSDIYFTSQDAGSVACIESGSFGWTPLEQERWLEVQELTARYYGSSVYIEPVTSAQVAVYEV